MKARKNTKYRHERVQVCLYELRHFILLDDGLVFTHSPSNSILTFARVFFTLPLSCVYHQRIYDDELQRTRRRAERECTRLSESRTFTVLNNFFLRNSSSQKSSARVYRHKKFCDVTVAKHFLTVLVQSPIFPLDL